jgi:DNA-binding transcriptional LysR family regulator
MPKTERGRVRNESAQEQADRPVRVPARPGTPGARGFDWALVQSFLAVLDAGSLSGAAKKLGAQQPTLSRQLASLEAQLGAPLFERTGRGVAPTALALMIADDARAMQFGAEQMQQRLTHQRLRTSGIVRITTSQVVASYLLPRVLAALSFMLTRREAPPRG